MIKLTKLTTIYMHLEEIVIPISTRSHLRLVRAHSVEKIYKSIHLSRWVLHECQKLYIARQSEQSIERLILRIEVSKQRQQEFT